MEVALAVGIEKAAAAQRWDVVAQLARELATRRLARGANVIALGAERRKREGGTQ